MGLDMYMFRVAKITDEEAASMNNIRSSTLLEKPKGRGMQYCYNYIHKNELDEDPDRFCDLIPFLTEISAVDTAFDYAKCFTDHGVNCLVGDEDDDNMFANVRLAADTDEVVGSYCGPNGAGWTFASGAKIDITREQYNSYLYDKVTKLYVWKAKEVAYWRKFYDLDEFVQMCRVAVKVNEIMENDGRQPTREEVQALQIENCGYYQLSRKEKNAIKDFLAENDAPYTARYNDGFLDGDSVIMYHAWW